MRSLLAATGLLGLCAALAPAATADGGPYVNSWLGNDFGTPAQHIPHTIDNLCVAPSGVVATICHWDEGGHNVAVYGADGVARGFPVESGTGSWGRNSGAAVFVDDAYVYQVMKQNGRDGAWANPDFFPQDPAIVWHCIRRYHHDGRSASFPGGKGYDGSMLIVAARADETMLSGVTLLGGELFVSDPVDGVIRVYDATTMSATPRRTFAIANPGVLDHDREGRLWMLDRVQRRLVRFTTAGVVLPQGITLPTGCESVAFCVDRVNDRILVADEGPAQNIRIYGGILGTPAAAGTFGDHGGVNAGVAGRIGPRKFSEPRGIGIDAAGCIYVGSNAYFLGGGRLEKYDPAGNLLWRRNGIAFTDNGDLDPADETRFYTKEFRFDLALGNTAPGSEWSLAANTLDPFRYPADPRMNGSSWSTGYVETVGGRRLLFVGDMYGFHLAAFRFDPATAGEIAIPAALLEGGSTAAERLWVDSDGDGAPDPGETYSQNPDNAYGTHVVPDSAGGIWKANRDTAGRTLRYFPFQGFAANGVPRWSFATSRIIPVPAVHDVKRVAYDAQDDVLYLVGRSTGAVPEVWWSAGDILVRYDHALDDARRTLAWSVPLPYGHSGAPDETNVKAFCQAGAYVFTVHARHGLVTVRRKQDGAIVGTIAPTADTDFRSGWADINGAVRARQRANGEYLVFVEENGFGKIMMYRWSPNRPPAAGTPTALPALLALP